MIKKLTLAVVFSVCAVSLADAQSWGQPIYYPPPPPFSGPQYYFYYEPRGGWSWGYYYHNPGFYRGYGFYYDHHRGYRCPRHRHRYHD